MGPHHTILLPRVKIGLWCLVTCPTPHQSNCAGASLAKGGGLNRERALRPREWQMPPCELTSHLLEREARSRQGGGLGSACPWSPCALLLLPGLRALWQVCTPSALHAATVALWQGEGSRGVAPHSEIHAWGREMRTIPPLPLGI